jgi:hypothetical protein
LNDISILYYIIIKNYSAKKRTIDKERKVLYMNVDGTDVIYLFVFDPSKRTRILFISESQDI